MGKATIWRRSVLRACVLSLVTLLSLAGCSASWGYGYEVASWPGCGGGWNSGGWDNAGRLYVPCGNPSTIRVLSADGRWERSIGLGFHASDVAPSPDGSYLYTASGGSAPRRLNRQADGSYLLDATWAASPYQMYGTTYQPRGHFITVDGNGAIYLADGAWSPNSTHTVIKYAPDGSVVTRFGEFHNSWNDGTFYWMLTGLVASRDGSRVFTAEVGNNRIQRWDRQADGSYRAVAKFGGTAANNADRGGYCSWGSWRGAFAAPYDVQLDEAGSLYVINTTCKQVLKFTQAGQYITDANVMLNGGDYPRPHGFAVAADGTVYVGENEKMLRRTDRTYPAQDAPASVSAMPAGSQTPATAPAPAAPSGTASLLLQQVTLRRTGGFLSSTGTRGIPLTVRCPQACAVVLRARIGTVSGPSAGATVRRSGVGSLRVRFGLGQAARTKLRRRGRLRVVALATIRISGQTKQLRRAFVLTSSR